MNVGLKADCCGCVPAGLPADKRAPDRVTDDFQHEYATCFNVKGKVLLSSTGTKSAFGQ